MSQAPHVPLPPALALQRADPRHPCTDRRRTRDLALKPRSPEINAPGPTSPTAKVRTISQTRHGPSAPRPTTLHRVLDRLLTPEAHIHPRATRAGDPPARAGF